MTDLTTPATDAESRPWAVKAITWLLFLQTAVLLAIAFLNFLALDLTITWDNFLVLLITALTSSIVFAALSLLALVAFISFLGAWRTGWTLAMLVQGFVLLVALVLYFNSAPFYIYPLMAFAAFLVLYLHHPDVEAAFLVRIREGEEV